jgi:hypothetical protein
MKVQMEQQELALQAKEQELESAKAMLQIETDRAKLEADIRLREMELVQKEEAQYDKANSDDMKNMIQAVDKMARANG